MSLYISFNTTLVKKSLNKDNSLKCESEREREREREREGEGEGERVRERGKVKKIYLELWSAIVKLSTPF